MANVKRSGSSIDAMAFELLADAFLDVTGVLMHLDPSATKELLQLIEERMVASLNGAAKGRGTSVEEAQASVLAVWKAGTAIKAAETVLSETMLMQ